MAIAPIRAHARKATTASGHHRQEQPDPVAPADPQPSHRPGQPAGLGVQLGVRQPADRPVLPLPDHGGPVAAG